MELQYEKGRIFALDPEGKLIAEILFPSLNGVAAITRTFVDESLRGQGMAGHLMEAAVDQIRSGGLKARPICSYAAKWFEKHPEQGDLL